MCWRLSQTTMTHSGDGFWNTKPSKTNTCKITHVKQASEHKQTKITTNKQVKQHKRNVLRSRLNLNKINNKYNNKHGQQQTQRVTSHPQNNVTKHTHMKQKNKSNKSRTWQNYCLVVTDEKGKQASSQPAGQGSQIIKEKFTIFFHGRELPSKRK